MAAERGAAADVERKRRWSEAVARLGKARHGCWRWTPASSTATSTGRAARLLANYRDEGDAAQRALADVEAAVAVEPLHVRYAAAVLERLPDVWRGASFQARDGLVGSIWPAGPAFSGGGFRTTPKR